MEEPAELNRIVLDFLGAESHRSCHVIELRCGGAMTGQSPLAKKLLIKPGNTILLINQPEGYADMLGELPEGAEIVDASHKGADIVHLFAGTKAELMERAPRTIKALEPGGVLWISYPKVSTGRSDLSREVLWSALEHEGWRPVTQVAIDDTWSAMRFRPEADVKSTRR